MTARSAAPTRPLQPVVLHLIRHGGSTWNAEGRLQGQVADVPLTHRGRVQAKRAAVQFASRGVDALFTSDLVRAAQTAHEVGVGVGKVNRLNRDSAHVEQLAAWVGDEDAWHPTARR